MAEQFDVSAEHRKVLEEKAKRRLALRAEFLKQASNPYRHATGEGGTVFDPAIQRFMAMRVYTVDHWRPTPTTVAMGIVGFLPFFIYGYYLKTTRDTREEQLRTGEVAYKDRLFKFI